MYKPLKVPKNEEELRDLLVSGSIDLALWDKEKPGAVDRLLRELKNSEGTLLVENNKLLRKIEIVVVNVFCEVSNCKYVLVEDRQEITHNGVTRVFTRNQPDGAVAEKLKIGESSASAVERGLREELKVSQDMYTLEYLGDTIKTSESPGYLGLNTELKIHKYKADLNPEAFRQTYVEIEEYLGKKIYFTWRTI